MIAPALIDAVPAEIPSTFSPEHPVRAALRDARRIVIKVGTGIVTEHGGRPCMRRLRQLTAAAAALRAEGREVVLVSSGSVGVGTDALGLRRPLSVVDRQAAAAAGQSLLMGAYLRLFGALGQRCAQVLLSEEDFSNRGRHVHLNATLNRLLDLGVIPVVNENDAVTTATMATEGGVVFSDNDRLAALTASALTADALLLLTDVEGVLSAPPGTPGSSRLPIYTGDEEIRIGTASSLGRGGIAAKIQAAVLGARAGVHVVIGSGERIDTISEVLSGQDVGTWFPAEKAPSGKRRWLAWATAPEGRLVVNEGARRALVERRASLLRPGIIEVEGYFDGGVVVSLVDENGVEFGRGRCDVPASHIMEPTVDRAPPIVHADHLVIFSEGGVDD
ncbi:MAG: glutamate 5-kinase [Deltaproteobacteria bacterium]|nr:MAG: glutamate 5-kinase [Deltaproteobacteria bacterium]